MSRAGKMGYTLSKTALSSDDRSLSKLSFVKSLRAAYENGLCDGDTDAGNCDSRLLSIENNITSEAPLIDTQTATHLLRGQSPEPAEFPQFLTKPGRPHRASQSNRERNDFYPESCDCPGIPGDVHPMCIKCRMRKGLAVCVRFHTCSLCCDFPVDVWNRYMRIYHQRRDDLNEADRRYHDRAMLAAGKISSNNPLAWNYQLVTLEQLSEAKHLRNVSKQNPRDDTRVVPVAEAATPQRSSDACVGVSNWQLPDSTQPLVTHVQTAAAALRATEAPPGVTTVAGEGKPNEQLACHQMNIELLADVALRDEAMTSTAYSAVKRRDSASCVSCQDFFDASADGSDALDGDTKNNTESSSHVSFASGILVNSSGARALMSFVCSSSDSALSADAECVINGLESSSPSPGASSRRLSPRLTSQPLPYLSPHLTPQLTALPRSNFVEKVASWDALESPTAAAKTTTRTASVDRAITVNTSNGTCYNVPRSQAVATACTVPGTTTVNVDVTLKQKKQHIDATTIHSSSMACGDHVRVKHVSRHVPSTFKRSGSDVQPSQSSMTASLGQESLFARRYQTSLLRAARVDDQQPPANVRSRVARITSMRTRAVHVTAADQKLQTRDRTLKKRRFSAPLQTRQCSTPLQTRRR